MTPAPLHVAGERLMLDPTGGVFWPRERILVVADLHLEKGSAAAHGGQLLPPWDSRVTLDRLAALIRRYAPARVVALGDSFHDSHAARRLPTAEAARLHAMADATPFVWVLGNHDPRPAGFAGETVAEWRAGPITLRHEAVPGPRGPVWRDPGGEMCGHHHPKARVAVRGTSVCRPCFVSDGRRLMLPALGAYTGGLDVRSPAISRLFPRGGRVFLLGEARLFSFAMTQLDTGAAAHGADDHRGVTDPSARSGPI